MCLRLRDREVHTSDEDIVCYKVVARIKNNNRKRYYSASMERYLSSYAKLNNVRVVARFGFNNRVIKKDDFINGIMIFQYGTEPFERIIDGGAIHSFTNLDNAIHARTQFIGYYEWTRKNFSHTLDKEYFIVKCIIPKGTPYYIGINGSGDKNYASRELIYDTIVED